MTGKQKNKPGRNFSFAFALLFLPLFAMVFVAVPASAGPNAGAGCAVDLDFTTTQIDTSMTVDEGDVFWVAIIAQDVFNLDTYQVKVNFDPTKLSFLDKMEEYVNPFDPSNDRPNILKTLGGETVGFQAALESEGVVNMSNALVGEDPAEAPEGDGLLGLLKFKVLDAINTSLTLSEVAYLDSTATEDMPTQLSGAELLSEGVPESPEIVFFTVAPSTIDEGDSALLSWSITGAETASINNGIGSVNVSGGNVNVSPSTTTTYTLTAANAGGQTTATATLTVVPYVAPPVITSFTVTPTSIESGQSAMLAWQITGADTASIDNGIGSVNKTGGSRSVSPSGSKTYTLTASNQGGTATASVYLQVTAPSQKPVITSFTATPTAIEKGQSSVLYWNISGANSASIDNGVGAINPSTGTISVFPTTNTTYTLTAINADGTSTSSVIVQVSTPVEPEPTIVSFGVAPSSIQQGDSAVLSWVILDASSAFINNGVGTVDASSGSVSVSPSTDTTYTLTAFSDGGSVSAYAPLTVTPVQGEGPNADAGCAIDMDYTTTEVESEKSIEDDEEFWIAIVAQDVSNLDTFQVEVNFDPQKLSYIGYAEENPFEGVSNLLKEDGGETIGLQVALRASGTLNVSNALVGNDPSYAPEGDGVLALLKFKVISAANTLLALSNVSYIDSYSIEDSPSQISGAQLVSLTPQPPEIDYFVVAPSSIAEGGNAQLSWSIEGATSASIDNGIGGVNAAGGSISVSPAASTSYTLTAQNAAGTATASVNLTVVPLIAKPTIVSFTVTPESIEEGESAELAWTVTDADSVYIDGGVGYVDASGGTYSVSPSVDRTYTLSATNEGGTTTSTVALEVTSPHVDGPNADAGCVLDLNYTTAEIESFRIVEQEDTFWLAVLAQDVYNLDTYQVEIRFDPARLSFLQGAAENPMGGFDNLLKTEGGQTLGFQAVLSSAGVVNVANSLVGSDEDQAPEGDGLLALLKFKVLDASANTDLVLENVSYIDCFGQEDTPSHIFDAAVGPFEIIIPVVNSFAANPSTITEGQTASLSWSVTDADSVVIDNGIGSVNPSGGTYQVSPGSDTTYTLTASHDSGGQATATVAIDVTPLLDAPTIEYFTASPQSIERGEQSLLSWSTSGADTAYIDNGVGYVNASSGYFSVYPDQNTTYTLMAINNAGSTSVTVTVSVDDPSAEGPNANAACLIDLDYTTSQIESSRLIRNGDQFWLVLVAQDVSNLDTYQVEVNFDPDKLEFVQGLEENAFASLTNILKTNGGNTVGFQAVEVASGTVNVANALVGTSQETAPEGDGVLALLQFTVLDASEMTSLVLSDISYMDSAGNKDAPANVSNGLLYVETVAKPVVEYFTVNPTSIVEGQSATLIWKIVNAKTATIDNGIGTVNRVNGSISVSPDQDAVYTLIASNDSGETTASVELSVEPAPTNGPNADAGCAIDLDYQTAEVESLKTFETGDQLWVTVVAQDVENLDTYQVEVAFDDSQLSFVAGYEENAIGGIDNLLKSEGGSTVGFQAVEYEPGAINIANALAGQDPAQAPEGDGVIALLKFNVVNAVSDTEITLSNVHYIDTEGADDVPSLISNATLRIPVTSTPTITSFVSTPESITVGDSAVLSWTVEGADSASIDNGIGAVNRLEGSVEISPEKDTVYQISAENSFGTVSATVEVQVSPVIVKPTIHFFKANPFVVYQGFSSTLSWSVTGADMVVVDNGVGVVASDYGEVDVAPEEDTTYKLTASNLAGDAVAYVTVQVDPPIELPVIERFDAVPAVVEEGDSALLVWEVAGADKVSIYNGVGPVHPVSGEYRVKPEFTATYTLIAENDLGETSVQTTLVVISAKTTAVVETGPGTGTVVGLSKGTFSQDLIVYNDNPTSSTPSEDWEPYFPFGFLGIEIGGLSPGEEVEVSFEAPSELSDLESQFYTYKSGYLDYFGKAYGLSDGDEKFVILVTDGGLGDGDGEADGKIVFTGGPSVGSGFGPNIDAACAIDMHYGTLAYDNDAISVLGIESSACGFVNEDIWFFIVAINVNNLDTFQAQVNFDPARLQFLGGAEDNAYEGVPNLLKKNGGTTMGFQAKQTSPGVVNIADSLIGDDPEEAPEGSGVIALLNFRVLDNDLQNAVSLSDVYFIDTFGSMRTPPLADPVTNLYGAHVNPKQIFVAETPQDCLDATECYTSCFNYFREGVDAVPDTETHVIVLPGSYSEPLVIDRDIVTVEIRMLTGPVILE